MATDKPKVEGTVLKFELPNETMRKEIEMNRGNLMRYLKIELQNTHITLVIKVNREKAKKFAYTPLEKYNKLKEKNPLVEKLKDTFGLDL